MPVGVGMAERGIGTADKAFHYTFGRAAASIEKNGLRAGSYATPNGTLSPLQAQIDLALSPNQGLRDALLSVDLAGLRQAGYQIRELLRSEGALVCPAVVMRCFSLFDTT